MNWERSWKAEWKALRGRKAKQSFWQSHATGAKMKFEATTVSGHLTRPWREGKHRTKPTFYAVFLTEISVDY